MYKPSPTAAVWLTTFVALGFITIAAAETIRVPADYSTIQAAIDTAIDGDEVVVADGTYTGYGNVQLLVYGKPITVRSENGPQKCIIDGQGTALVGFYLTEWETPETVINGFTLSDFCGS
jgi:hypothetical protein